LVPKLDLLGRSLQECLMSKTTCGRSSSAISQ
jgi:hypothetical protein